jgi:RNA polymerase sigma factor (sigma-70 family)
VRFAARYAGSLQDAEDAYQRAMEIALMRAPVAGGDAFTAWLHVVIRNEAIAITDAQRRELPIPDDDLQASVAQERSAEIAQPDAVLEWRERYRAIQDAICGLTSAQRMCLMLRSAGLSRLEIEALTGYSERKVHRSIIEGRSRLQAWEIRMAAGEECARAGELIDMTVDNSASRRERRALSRHLHHCHACRSQYRSRRDQVRMLGSMVPTVLIGGEALLNGPPDPSFVLAWWERATSAAGVRTAQAMQVMMDLPALASTKAGAGAIAAAAAGALGTPMVVDAVRSERAAPTSAARVQAAAAPTGSPATPPIRLATPPASATRTTSPPPVRARVTARAASSTGGAKRTDSPSFTYRTSTPVRTGGRSSASRVSPAMEFGP